MKLNFFAKKRRQAHDESQTATRKARVWSHLRCRVDRSAVENISMRRFCKRAKIIITGILFRSKILRVSSTDCHLGRSDHASTDGNKASRKTRFLRPLKRVWKRANSKMKVRQQVYVKISHGSQSSIDRERMARCPHVAIVAEEDEPRSSDSSKPELSPREPSITLPQSSESTLVVRTPSPAPTPIIATVEITLPANQENSHAASTALVEPIAAAECAHNEDSTSADSQLDDITIQAFPSPPANFPQAQTIIENESSEDEKVSPVLGRQILPEKESSRTLPIRFSTSDYNQSLASSSTASDRPSSKLKITTPSERADYDRIMKVFYRQQASRIPIPTTWRSSTSRAYLFRGPSSPYRSVVTTPVSSTRRESLDETTKFATEPRRPTAVPCVDVPSLNAASTLQNIAARPTMQFPAPRPVVSEASTDTSEKGTELERVPLGSPANPAELPGSEVSSPSRPRKHPGRGISRSLPMPRGSFEEEAAEEIPRKRKRHSGSDHLNLIAVLNGPSRRTAIPTVSTPRPVSMPTHLRFPKTVPEARSARPISELQSAMARSKSRIPRTIGGPSRVRFLEPVTLDEGSTSTVDDKGTARVRSIDEDEISRRVAAIKARARSHVRGDDEDSIGSIDEIWFDASNVAVIDERLR